MPDNDPKWKIPSPRDYLAIKYSAPPGACKCGECQLVPPEMLMTWEAQIKALTEQVTRSGGSDRSGVSSVGGDGGASKTFVCTF